MYGSHPKKTCDLTISLIDFRGYANKSSNYRISEHERAAATVGELERKLAELERRKAALQAELRRVEEALRQRDEEERQWREALDELAEFIEEGELQRLGLAEGGQ